ncbi:MAG: LysR family transcriptional regulator [Paucimonas sp.]|nr:LysR family transcriptional regulator [Paucimonas sp.]
MRNIDLDSLQIFKAVIDCGGVTRAAAQLNRVQSNITTRIKNLEERLGVPLFDRHKGVLRPSAEGRLLLGYAERLLALSAEAEAALRSGVPMGTLKLGTLESTAATRLPRVLSDYHRQYPEVTIELATGTTGALIDRVLNCQLEAAFVSEPYAASGLAHAAAFEEELVLITPLRYPAVVAPRDLLRSTVIAFPHGCSYRRTLEAWLNAGRVVPDRVLELASYHAIVACVAAGSGIAFVPRSVLRVVQPDKGVKVHALPPKVSRTHTHLVWRQGHASIALDALLQSLPAGRVREAA